MAEKGNVGSLRKEICSHFGELQNVFQNLPTYLITKHETSEISVMFAASGALLAALAILLSMLWQPLA